MSMQRGLHMVQILAYYAFWVFAQYPVSAEVPGDIHWRFAPATIRLEGADLYLAEGMIYLEGAEMRRFLEAAGNPLEGNELAVVAPRDVSWFAVFTRQPEQPPIPGNGDWRERPGFDERTGRTSWAVNSTEPDGRKVVSRTVYIPNHKPILGAEMLCEARTYDRSKMEFEAILDQIHLGQRPERETSHSRISWISIGFVVGFVLIPAAVAYYRQRAL